MANENDNWRIVTQFRIYGVPAPGGSKRIFYNKKTGRAIVTDDSKRNKPWRQAVAGVAAETYQEPLLTSPVALQVQFVLPRPKSHYRTGKFAGQLKDSAPHLHTKRPDATKLLRAVEDALTGIVWRDDAAVCRQVVEKFYGDRPGAAVIVSVPKMEIEK